MANVRVHDRLFEPGHPLDVLEMTEEETGALLTISRDKEEERAIESHSFLQVNDKVCELLYAYVLSRPYRGTGKLLDGYCGVGLLTERFLETFKTVIGIEADRSSATDAKNRIKERNLFPAMTVNNQTIEQFLRHTKEKFDTVILNPPRSGMSKEARQSILKTEPTDVVMISCHPAAMVRDLQEFLDQKFSICSIQPFDMFPQTHHLETVLHLQK